MTTRSEATRKLFVHAELIDAKSGETFDTVNPATGEVICPVQVAGIEDVDDAVASAKKGFETWAGMSGAQRGRILGEAARILRSRNDDIARIEVLDTGKPISEAIEVDVQSGADAIEYYAGMCSKLHGEHYDLPPHAFAYTRREPLGVCAGLGAWNYPVQIACWKSAPALACGNAMIFKPSELTPLTALELAACYTDAGVPPGVFNVVQGAMETGRLLSRHPGIAKVSLTGAVTTGRAVMADAASNLKHVTMELGGKSPLILFDDCDLDAAVSAAMMANFYTQGEICSNGTRVFVQKGILDAFMNKLLPRIEALRIGDPLDPKTQIGALISEQHLERVLGYVQAGRSAGARLVIGGERPADLPRGNFISPAVFDRCTDDMSIVREEIFGPVMCVLDFENEDEVIARANDTEFGLAAGVFTKDITRAHRVVARLQAGTCWINNYNITPVEVPFGGTKQSGIGRENSLITIEHYSQLKTVYVELGEVEAPF
jgi:betaine-aldehyde dehydrogenase